MKRNLLICSALTWLALFTLNSQLTTAFAQGTAFTYQGRLNSSGTPANGLFDLRFKLFVDPLGNNQSGSAVLTNGVPVADGLFTVTLDFGAGTFNGTNYWLEIDVKTNGPGTFVNLSPLQAVTPAPYAVFAETSGNAGLAAGTYSSAVTLNNPADSFSGSFVGTVTGNGGGLTNVNAVLLGGFGAAGFWNTSGNTATAPGTSFLGTTDNQPLELKVNGSRALRLEPDTNNIGAPNVIGGAPNNFVDPGIYGATIAGGGVLNYLTNGFEPGPGSNHVSAIFGTVGGGRRNTVAADHSTIGGGHDNLIQAYAYDSVISGGEFNTISNDFGQSVIAGGNFNRIGGFDSVVSGGYFNTVTLGYGTVSGGFANTSGGYYATVPGGNANSALGDYSFAAGQYAAANHPGAFVWSDSSSSTTFSSTATNQFSVRAAGGVRFVTGGQGLTLDGPFQGNGSGLTSLNAANITSGTLPGARLPPNVPLLDAGLNTFAGDLSMSGGAAYHNLSLSGGNALGYLYGSYAALNDGIHLGYNYYADAAGADRVFNTGGATSRITAGYGFISLLVGPVDSPPSSPRLVADLNGVSVYGTFNNQSDRNAKQDFAPIDPSGILNKVARLPVTEWSYKEDARTRHIGPVAQDFHSVFNLGTDDKHIAPMDEGGVALAAIQALNQKLKEEEAIIERRGNEIAQLKQSVAELRQLVQSLAEKK